MYKKTSCSALYVKKKKEIKRGGILILYVCVHYETMFGCECVVCLKCICDGVLREEYAGSNVVELLLVLGVPSRFPSRSLTEFFDHFEIVGEPPIFFFVQSVCV